MKEIQSINCALIGVGSVGRTLLSILKQKEQLLKKLYSLSFNFLLLSDSTGCLWRSDGIGFDIDTIIKFKSEKKSLSTYKQEKSDQIHFGETLEVLRSKNRPDLNLLFESSPLNIKTGEPGLGILRESLSQGIHVVLANKGPLIACSFEEFIQFTSNEKASLLFSATFCGGLPVLNVVKNDLQLSQIKSFRGIFNSTTNFILEKMLLSSLSALSNSSFPSGSSNEEDSSSLLRESEMMKLNCFDRSLLEAQRRGIAETDPSLDVDGWDTSCKLLIFCRSALNFPCTLSSVSVTGIRGMTESMLLEAWNKNKVYKLIAEASLLEESSSTSSSIPNYKLSVSPQLVEKDSFLGKCSGWEMAVELITDLYPVVSMKLFEREPVATSSSMIRDALNILCKDSRR